MREYRRILITGGAGFVGCALARRLRQWAPDAGISALDNLKRRGSELNLRVLREAEAEFLHGDIRNLEDLLAVSPPPDLIVECSAEPSVLAGYDGSPEYLVRTNFLGCFHCLELARRVRADFVFLSTSRVYPIDALNALCFHEDATRYALAAQQQTPGASQYGIAENFPLAGSRSLYGMTKLGGELMVEEYAAAYGLRTIINRCGLLTGPGQMARSDQGVIALWVAAHYFQRPLRYIGFGGQGKQVRDFLHVEDFADLLIDQLENFDAYRSSPWNVGGGVEYSLSLQELTALCRETTGRVISIGSDPVNRPADVRIYLSDTRAVSAVRGWKPRRNAAQTVSDIHAWVRREEAALRHVL